MLIVLIAANVASYFWIQQTIGSGSAGEPAQFASSTQAANITLLRELGQEALSAQTAEEEQHQDKQNTPAPAPRKKSTPQPEESINRVASLKPAVPAVEPAPVIPRAELVPAEPQLEPLAEGLCWFVDGAPKPRQGAEAEWLNTLAAYLGELGINADIVEVEVPKPLKYVVYLPAAESKSAALARLRSLLADGYDAFVFREGEYRNAISLGFYSQKEIAHRMLDKFRGEGLAVELAPWRTFRTDARLRVDNPSSGKLAGRLWKSVAAEWNGIEREKKYCDAVAQR